MGIQTITPVMAALGLSKGYGGIISNALPGLR